MKLGIIGGSGLYQIEGMEVRGARRLDTPFGSPSDAYTIGALRGVEVVFLPRHGAGHVIAPHEINHRANIFGMKLLDVTHILSISAVGSLRQELAPRDVVIVDQYCDRTKRSEGHTFFGGGVVAHVAFGDPVCPELRMAAFGSARQAIAELDVSPGAPAPKAVDGGCYVNMEGPAFSTKAESLLYKSWDMDVIGMTNLAEAKLSREAEICYCTAAMVTDYDCWHPEHDHVSVDMVRNTFAANVKLAKTLIVKTALASVGLPRRCACGGALSGAILTAPEMVSDETRRRLAPLIGKYLPPRK